MNRFVLYNLDHEYEQGSLREHLIYLHTWGGTPDCWDSFDDAKKAIDAAVPSGLRISVVDTDTGAEIYRTD